MPTCFSGASAGFNATAVRAVLLQWRLHGRGNTVANQRELHRFARAVPIQVRRAFDALQKNLQNQIYRKCCCDIAVNAIVIISAFCMHARTLGQFCLYREICTLYPGCSVENVEVACGETSRRRRSSEWSYRLAK